MATGTISDFANRMRGVLPPWFPGAPAPGAPETAPVLMGLLTGLGSGLAAIYSLFGYAAPQARLATASGAFLDAFAEDYLGTGLLRNPGEADLTYRSRIAAALFQAKGTRAALVAAVQSLTGSAPSIVEPLNASDTKGRGSIANPAVGGGYGYGAPGLAYGSLNNPAQLFMTVALANNLTAAEVLTVITAVAPAGVIVWVNITGGPAPLGTFVTGSNTMVQP